MPRIGIGLGLGNQRGGGTDAPPAIVAVGSLIYAPLGSIDPGAGTVTVRVASGTAWSLTVNGQAAAVGVGTGANQAASVTATAAMVGVGVAVELTANGIVTDTTTVTAAWTTSDLAPTLWTLASEGITIGDTGTVPADLTTWSNAGGATPTASGSDFTLTATAGNTTHYASTAPAGATVGPCEVTIEAVAGTADWLSIGLGANALAWFDLSTGVVGTGGGSAYIAHAITSLGGGRYRCVLQATFAGGDTTRIGLGTADNAPTWNAAGTETITVRAIPSFGLGGATIIIQRCVSAWADARVNGLAWTQPTAGRQPVYWSDAKGPCLVFSAFQWMLADAIASARNGTNIPFWCVAAIDGMAGTTARSLYSFGCTLHARDHRLDVPESATVAADAWRYNDAGTGKDVPKVTAAPLAQGAIVSSFDGTTGSLHYGAAALVTANSAIAGDATTDRLTLGALRRNGSASQLFQGKIREFAIDTTHALTGPNITLAHDNRTTKYGY
jgi:hypothetical protein